jgi:hypothetical protein
MIYTPWISTILPVVSSVPIAGSKIYNLKLLQTWAWLKQLNIRNFVRNGLGDVTE